MPIKAIIWDLGGVIMRTEDPNPRQELAAELGITRQQLEMSVFAGEVGQQAQRGDIRAADLWEAVRQTYKLTPEGLRDFQHRFWGGDQVDQELVAYIRTLRGQYKTALLSNAWDNLRQVLNHDWKIADAFDTLTISAEEGVMKPDPRIYQIALKRTGVAPEEAVFIDDFLHNIEGARAVGMHGIHFQSRTQALNELENLLHNQ